MSPDIQSIDRLILKGGRVVDPQTGLDDKTDLLIADGKIEGIGSVNASDALVIDCSDQFVIPGLLDMHVHLREPGQEHKETIETGCNAAAAGGFTAVACMPNTSPPIDCRADVEFINKRSAEHLVEVHPIPAVTVGMQGERLTEMADMLEAGAVAFSDDGKPVADSALFRRALEYVNMLGCPLIEHCEDEALAAGGAMHEGDVSTALGIPAIPGIAEDVAVSRALLIAEYTEGPLHLAHISSAGSVRLIREAKARGVRVTAETCPHYLTLTDEAVRSFSTSMKMNPPLRSESDQKALIEGLQDGTLDAICTDHAPHAFEDKECEFQSAAFGIAGLETSLGLIWTHLVEKKRIDLNRMIELMAVNPRKILNLPDNQIRKGMAANLTVFDPLLKWTVDSERFLSKARNTPFNTWELQGRCTCVVNRRRLMCNTPASSVPRRIK